MFGQKIKKETNIHEVIFYLEEMAQMDMLTDWEEDILYQYKFNGDMPKAAFMHVCKQIQKWQTVKF